MLEIDSEKQFIFESGQPFQSSHASTVAALPGGAALAAWFAGKYEKSSDVAIWMSRRTADGVWSAPYKAVDEEGAAHWKAASTSRKRSARGSAFWKIDKRTIIVNCARPADALYVGGVHLMTEGE